MSAPHQSRKMNGEGHDAPPQLRLCQILYYIRIKTLAVTTFPPVLKTLSGFVVLLDTSLQTLLKSGKYIDLSSTKIEY